VKVMVSGWDKSPKNDNDYVSGPVTVKEIIAMVLFVALVVAIVWIGRLLTG
jgi:hypothetical protein